MLSFVVLVIGFLVSIAGNEVSLQQTPVKIRPSTNPNKTKQHIETKEDIGVISGPLAPLAVVAAFQESYSARRSHTEAAGLLGTASLSALYLDRRKTDVFKDLEIILFGHLKPHKILNSGRLNRIRMQVRSWRDALRSTEEFKKAMALSRTTVATAPLPKEEEEEDSGGRNKSGEKQTTSYKRRFVAAVAPSISHVTRRANGYVVRRRSRLRGFSRGRRSAEGESSANTLTFSSVPTLMAANDEWEVADVGHRTRRRQRTTTMGVYFTRVRAEIFIQKEQISKKVTEKASKTQGVIIALLVLVVVAILIIIVLGVIKKKKKPVEAPKAGEKQPLITSGTTGVPPPSPVAGATAPTTTTTTKPPAEQPVLMLGMIKTTAPAAAAAPSSPHLPPSVAPSSTHPATAAAAAAPAATALPPLSPSASSPASPHPRAPPTQPTTTSTTSAPPSMVSRAPGAPHPIPASKGALALASKISVAQPPVPMAHKAPSSSAPSPSSTKRK